MARGLLDSPPRQPPRSNANGHRPAGKLQRNGAVADAPASDGTRDLASTADDETQTPPPPPASDETDTLSALCHRLSQAHANPSLHVTPSHILELKSTPIPRPSPTQVLLHVRATGICGSDLHLWHRGSIGPLVVDRPCVLGHEAAGVVVAAGSAVRHLAVGDRVAVEPGVPCESCWLCRAGRYNLCEAVAFAGVCPAAGTARRFAAHEARFCHRLPASVTFAQGALLEPLSVVLHALGQCTGVGIGRPLLVCGAGPIGLIALKAARASGAWPLVVTDVEEGRLEFARRFVPGVLVYRVDATGGIGPEGCAEEIRGLFGVRPKEAAASSGAAEDEYRAPATVLECTGVESSVATAAYCCRRGGEVLVVGVGRSVMDNLPFMHLSLAEVGFLPPSPSLVSMSSHLHHPSRPVPCLPPPPRTRLALLGPRATDTLLPRNTDRPEIH